MHDAITIGVPVFVILLGIFFNNQGNRDIRDEVKDARKEAKADVLLLIGRVDRIESDLKHFYEMLGKHEGKIESLEKRPA